MSISTVVILLALLGQFGTAFRSAIRPALKSMKRISMSDSDDYFELTLVRHGESTWNEENKFTGWYDCPLSEKGMVEAKSAGVLLRENNFKFDKAYSSFLQRAIRTCWFCLEETSCMYIPLETSWQLNERHYGALQGLDKKETVDKYGVDQVNVWRRSYDIPPPDCEDGSSMLPANDPKYASLTGANTIKAESLATTLERVLPFWHSDIAPTVKSGKKVLIAAHGNSLRALVKYLDDIPEDVIANLNIPTGVPLVYKLDKKTLKPIKSPDALAPLSGRYLGNMDDIRARIDGVKNQTK